MRPVLVAEGDGGHHNPVLRQVQDPSDSIRVHGDGRLRNCPKTNAFGSQQEGGDISTAVQNPVDAHETVCGYDADMRCTKEPQVFACLGGSTLEVLPLDSKARIELVAGLAPTLLVYALIPGRGREV